MLNSKNIRSGHKLAFIAKNDSLKVQGVATSVSGKNVVIEDAKGKKHTAKIGSGAFYRTMNAALKQEAVKRDTMQRAKVARKTAKAVLKQDKLANHAIRDKKLGMVAKLMQKAKSKAKSRKDMISEISELIELKPSTASNYYYGARKMLAAEAA